MRKTLMLSAAAMFTLCAIAFSGEPGNVEAYKFKFSGDNGSVDLELNSETMGFSLHDLQPGDSRTTVTDDGDSITISRLDEVYTLDVGGEVFEIPARHGPSIFGGHMGGHAGSPAGAHHVTIAHGMGDGLTILSKEPLDETRRATIRAALSAAGIVDDIEFLSPGLAMMSGDETIEEQFEDDGIVQRRKIIKRVITE